jgi:nitric oxide reductase NorD protein
MLEQLQIADPQTHVWVHARVATLNPPPSGVFLRLLEDEAIWALTQDQGFGQTFIRGLLELQSTSGQDLLATYCGQVHAAAFTGITLGRIVATHLVPVLCHEQGLLNRFMETLAIMKAKGTYTLSAPLEMLSELLNTGDLPAARTYLDLLAATFRHDMSYNQSLRLVYLLPKAVGAFGRQRRQAQIAQLQRAVETDPGLAETFVEGMSKGLALLSEAALSVFMDAALEKFHVSSQAGHKFLALASQISRDTYAALQVAVPLTQVQGRLDRYIAARLGRPVSVAALSAITAAANAAPWCCSDGHTIFLPEEIEYFDRAPQNKALYTTLARLEACHEECGSFDFDMERAADTYPAVAYWLARHDQSTAEAKGCQAQRWFNTFPIPTLAEDLFTLLDQARIMRIMTHRYPGLIRQERPILQAEAQRVWQGAADPHPLIGAYARLVLDMATDRPIFDRWRTIEDLLAQKALKNVGIEDPVESVAFHSCQVFEDLVRYLPQTGLSYQPLPTPFGWRLRWPLVEQRQQPHARIAEAVKKHLETQGVKVYRSDLRKWLASRDGKPSTADLQVLISTHGIAHTTPQAGENVRIDVEAVLKAAGCQPPAGGTPNGSGCRYDEWDCQVQDYLHGHTYVQERELSLSKDRAFFKRTLSRYPGMLARIRRAFELLKPEGLTLLRQWPEGDAFDYRALLDFAVDRRAGRIPSDRLFIKRLKKERNVAVLVLVDMSRSTANLVNANQHSVLDVAKEALVLFCEALEVVGDTYAIAGFSGTGRHAVDYYGIKGFHEGLTQRVQDRISAMAPQRSTRMGAAIRHATVQLSTIPAAVRLLILVSDGFPNDLGYKSDYAIADTCKAIQEARARNLHVKAITVNIGSDPRLDELYGRYHYHVIEEVLELPDKLIRMYGTLTKV